MGAKAPNPCPGGPKPPVSPAPPPRADVGPVVRSHTACADPHRQQILAAIQAIDAASGDAMNAMFNEPDATRAAYEVSRILAAGHGRAQDLVLAAIWQRTPEAR